jgi:TonB family protein
VIVARYWIAVLAFCAGTSAFAQTQPDAKAAQNAANWEIFQQFYPKRAIAAKEEGAVGFKVTLDSRGLVTDCQITHSSGHPLLDQETCNVITLHAQFKPDPGLSPSQVHTSEGMIAWKLPASTTSLGQPKAVQSAELDKVVCKSNVRTGSLADVERTCMTVSEWGRQSKETRDFWEELQGRKASTHGD